MFEALKALISDLTSDPETPRVFDENDHRLAAVALLVHVADSDGATRPAEAQRLREIVAERFGLDSDDTSRLIEAAIRSDREAVDLYRFTSILKRALDEAGRLKVVEMMWSIAYADGDVDELEDNVVWRVAELLGVSASQRIGLRQRIESQGGTVDGGG